MATKSKAQPARPRLGRTPSADADQRHSHILDAATEVFLQRGFSGATVSAIARQANCSLETLYAAYPTKARMFAALTARRSTGIFEAVGPLDRDRDLREALLLFAAEVLALMTRPDVKNLHRLIVAECQAFPELGRNFWMEGAGSGLSSLENFFILKQGAGEMTVSHPMRAAEVFIALVLGMVSMRSTVGLSTAADSRKQQAAWAAYATGLFMTLLEARAL
jgi:TetR/AcrR family transcriptional repressor of mexJK operon